MWGQVGGKEDVKHWSRKGLTGRQTGTKVMTGNNYKEGIVTRWRDRQGKRVTGTAHKAGSKIPTGLTVSPVYELY